MIWWDSVVMGFLETAMSSEHDHALAQLIRGRRLGAAFWVCWSDSPGHWFRTQLSKAQSHWNQFCRPKSADSSVKRGLKVEVTLPNVEFQKNKKKYFFTAQFASNWIVRSISKSPRNEKQIWRRTNKNCHKNSTSITNLLDFCHLPVWFPLKHRRVKRNSTNNCK